MSLVNYNGYMIHPAPVNDAGIALNNNFKKSSDDIASLFARTISTTTPLTGGGILAANLTLAIAAASGAGAGSMSAANYTLLNAATANSTVHTLFLRDGSGGGSLQYLNVPTIGSSALNLSINAESLSVNANSDSTYFSNGALNVQGAEGVYLSDTGTSNGVHTDNNTLDDGSGGIWCQTLYLSNNAVSTDGTSLYLNGIAVGVPHIVYGDGQAITFSDGSFVNGLWTSYPPTNPDPLTGLPAGGFSCLFSGLAYVCPAAQSDPTVPTFVIVPASAPDYTTFGVGVTLFALYDSGKLTTFRQVIDDGSGNATFAGVITPIAGTHGVSTNSSAAAGIVGEIITATLASASAVSLASGTAKTITSVSLTAGDWDLTGTVAFHPGSTTTTTYLQGGIGIITNAMPGLGAYFSNNVATATTAVDPVEMCPTVRLSLAATTTVFLVAQAGFATSTLTAYGFIRARRVR